jgi:predicted nucleotidyltransferase
VLARYPQVDQAILYGSRSTGLYRHGSDIDLTLLGGEELTLSVLGRIMDDLDELLLPYTFDLSIFHHLAGTELIRQIRRSGITFYDRALSEVATDS